MTRTQKLLRLLATALIAALVAGGVANTILGATPLKAGWPPAYLWAFGAALLGAAMCSGTPGLVAALSAAGGIPGVTLLGGAFGRGGLLRPCAPLARAATLPCWPRTRRRRPCCWARGWGCCFFLLVRKRGSVFFAAAIALVAILAACALGETQAWARRCRR